MKIILYTAPKPVTNEIEVITTMLSNGVDYLYLRRENRDSHYWSSFVEQIPAEWHDKIICSDFRTLHEMQLGGFHFKAEMLGMMEEKDILENLSMMRKESIRSSRTVRSVEEIKANDGKYDILLVAPIFESISKQGHSKTWDFDALKAYLHHRSGSSEIFALGGVDADKVDMLYLLGFDGMALLGAIWEQPEQALTNFQKIKERCQQ